MNHIKGEITKEAKRNKEQKAEVSKSRRSNKLSNFLQLKLHIYRYFSDVLQSKQNSVNINMKKNKVKDDMKKKLIRKRKQQNKKITQLNVIN